MSSTAAARLIRPFFADSRTCSAARELLARSGIDETALDASGARVDHDLLVDLVELAVQVTGDERLGLHGAMHLGTGIFQVLDYLGRASPTIADALRTLARYQTLLHDGFRFDVQARGREWLVTVDVEPGLRFPVALAEFCMASLFLAAYRMGLPPVQSRVFFKHAAPEDTREYLEVFRAPVRFEAEANYAILPAASVEMRLPEADPVLRVILEGHADRQLEHLPRTSSWSERTRALVAEELRAGHPSLIRISQRLGVSPRTLRRRLIDEGTSFLRVTDDLRRDLALSYLEQGRGSVEELALFLGFSEASALRRAFKRWTGRSLTDTRHRP
ncbi:MAG TPA: AraC family transcriptional regulator [Polyangiaceae bacterium]|nr:AraC family transcriptional regulator [Polyangiaceae bacterium]